MNRSYSRPYSPFILQIAAPRHTTDDRAVFFILDNVERWHDLANAMPSHADIVLLDSHGNGLQGMADYLANHRDLDVIHLLSHGAAGQIDLGALALNSANLQEHAPLLAQVGRALKAGGDWLIYGCEVAKGETGQGFIQALAQLSHANVAASRDLTGSASQSATWRLETQVGTIDASRILQVPHYEGVLANITQNFNGAPAGFDPATGQPYFTWTSGLYKYTVTYQGNDYNQAYLQTGGPLTPNGVAPNFGSGTMLKVADIQPNSPLLLTIERVDGAVFNFLSLDVYNNDDNTLATIKGSNSGSTVFTDTVAAQSGKTISHSEQLTKLEVSGRTDPFWAIAFVVDNFVTVGPDNLPTLTATGLTASYFENADKHNLFSLAAASTQDQDQVFTGMTLTVSNLSDGGNEVLVAGVGTIALTNGSAGSIDNVGNYSVSVAGNTATVTFSNLNRVDQQMNYLINAVGYRNDSEDPTAGTRVVTLTSLTDNGATNNVLTTNVSASITVVPVNDAPTFSATGASPNFTKGDASVTLFNGVTVSTIEAGQSISSLSLNVAHVVNGSQEKLVIDGTEISLIDGSGITQSGMTYTAVANGSASDSTVTVTLSGGALGSDPATLIESLAYLNTSAAPTPGERTITITSIQDNGGTANGGEDTASVSTSSSVLVINVVAPPNGLALSTQSDTGVAGDGITSVTTPVLQGTAPAGSTVTVYLNDTTPTSLGTATADGSGNWTFTPTQPLSQGTHTFYAKATDASGTDSANSSTLTLTIDTTAPGSPGITTSTGPTNTLTPTVTGTAEAGSTVTLYDTNGTTVLGTATTNGSGQWTITSSTLVVGNHTLTAKATDVAGNVSSASAAQVFNVSATDITPPVLVSAKLTGTLLVLTYSEPVVANQLGLNPFTLKDGGQPVTLDGATATVLGNTVTFTLGSSLTSANLTLTYNNTGAAITDLFANNAPGFSDLAVNNANVPVVVVPPPTNTTVDGVVVDTQPVTLPGGQPGTQVSVPIVTDSRVDQSGAPGVADIPLVTGNGNTVLLAQVPTGYGLTSTGGGSTSVSGGVVTLKAAINAVTTNSADQAHLHDNGQAALNALAAGGNVLVQTLTLVAGNTAPGSPLVVNGTANDNQHTALVIDATKLPAGSALALNAVEFAAVVGAVSVTGNTAGQVLSGDGASQNFTVTAAGSKVFAGGGNDTLSFTASTKATAPQTTLLQGGTGNDTGLFTDAQSAYVVEQHAGYTLVTRKDDPDSQVKLVNVENLKFADSSITVQTTTTQSALAALYENILGRQADVGGFEFWSNATEGGQSSLGQTALALVQSVENASNGFAMNGQSSHDVAVLYKAILGREADATGLAFWTQQKDNGASLATLASAFVTSTELVGQYKAAVDWDFVA